MDDAGRIATLAAAFGALSANRFDLAATLSAPLIAANPDDTEALLLCGLAAGVTGHIQAAAHLLRSAARTRGDVVHPIHDLIGLLRRTGQTAAIEAHFNAALRLEPADRALLYGFGDFLYDSGRFADAVPVLEESLRGDPTHQPSRNLLAMTQAALGRTETAIEHLRHALRLDPYQARVWANLGLLLKDDGGFGEAISAYDAALTLAPLDAQIRVNRVVALLRAGLWADAWPDYEWRLRLADQSVRPRLLPMLATLPDLFGMTILAVHEDGFGDTLHFARYLSALAARGARVVAAVPPVLSRLIQRVEGVAAVCDVEDPWPAHDFYCPFFSLPRAFETTPETIPAPIPYLRADAVPVEDWRQRLPSAPLRVGLVWAGQARPMLPGFGVLDGRRSMALTAFAPLAEVPGVVFVSLQHGPEAVQAMTPPEGMTLFDPMGAVRSFADTAAIIANLDLVIGVDTAVVHLAGGMGKPVFLLDRYDHCWRWLSGRTDSPWYPAMRIFRQTRIGDWSPVLRAVADALAEFASERAVARARECRAGDTGGRLVVEAGVEARFE